MSVDPTVGSAEVQMHRLCEARDRATRRILLGEADELLELVGIDSIALRTFAREAADTAAEQGASGKALFGAGFLMALECLVAAWAG